MPNFWENISEAGSGIGGAVGGVLNPILGGKTETSQQTTTVEKPSSNTGLIVGGIAVAIVAIIGLIWAFGGFKKKKKKE